VANIFVDDHDSMGVYLHSFSRIVVSKSGGDADQHLDPRTALEYSSPLPDRDKKAQLTQRERATAVHV